MMLVRFPSIMGISLTFFAMMAAVQGSPLAQQPAAQATTGPIAPGKGLAADYVQAWSAVLDSNVTTDGQVVHQADKGLGKRVSPLGQTQYVAIMYRRSRWYISLVTVINTWAALPDPFTLSADIATSITQSSRQVIGIESGRWAVAAWSFFSNVEAEQFTVVTRMVFPNFLETSDVRRLAKTLAIAWGIDTRVPFFYPVNGNLKRDVAAASDDGGKDIPKITIYSNFKPTKDLADQLIAKFHSAPRIVANGTDPKAGSDLQRRDPASGAYGKCASGADTARRVTWAIPGDTQYDEGCLGSLSDFT